MSTITPIGRARETQTTLPCVDPATLEKLGEVPIMPPDEVEARVARARVAQAAWGRSPFKERRRLLRAILDHVLEHADELCEVVVRDSGKTRENAMLGEIWPVCEKLRWTVRHGERYLRPERIGAGLLAHKRATIEYHPLGVVGIITPWNYPLQNVLGPAIPALMAGNAAVVKVSEWTSWSAARFQRIFDQACDAVSVSRDLVQIVTGTGETGAALVRSGVDLVVFTGSVPNGRRVMAGCVEHLTPVILELGGKDAFIVCGDAALEQAVHAALNGVFIAAGQNCLAAERVIVVDAIYDRFVARIVEETARLRQGPPLGAARVDVGAMTMPRQLEIVEALVADAVAKGARVRAGGRRNPAHAGQFFEPTVLTDVTPDMAIMTEETFGPVMVIARVADEAEAVRLANATQFGLSSTVMTRDRRKAERLARQIVAGSTNINDFGLAYMSMGLPFGGVKASGFGRLNGRYGLRACTNVKAVLSDRLPVHAPARLYPVGDGDYDTARAAIRAIYTRGVGARIRHGAALVRRLLRGRPAPETRD